MTGSPSVKRMGVVPVGHDACDVLMSVSRVMVRARRWNIARRGRTPTAGVTTGTGHKHTRADEAHHMRGFAIDMMWWCVGVVVWCGVWYVRCGVVHMSCTVVQGVASMMTRQHTHSRDGMVWYGIMGDVMSCDVRRCDVMWYGVLCVSGRACGVVPVHCGRVLDTQTQTQT